MGGISTEGRPPKLLAMAEDAAEAVWAELAKCASGFIRAASIAVLASRGMKGCGPRGGSCVGGT